MIFGQEEGSLSRSFLETLREAYSAAVNLKSKNLQNYHT